MTAVNSVDILLIYNISLKMIYFFFFLAFAFTLVTGQCNYNETGEQCPTDSARERVKSFCEACKINGSYNSSAQVEQFGVDCCIEQARHSMESFSSISQKINLITAVSYKIKRVCVCVCVCVLPTFISL